MNIKKRSFRHLEYICRVILKTLFSLLLTLWFLKICAQADPVIYTVYLIGDTGKDTLPSEALQLLSFECFDDTSSALVLLGDNVYQDGNNPRDSPRKQHRSERILFSQLEQLSSYRGNFFILPGNHDWSSGKSSGHKGVKHQQELANEWSSSNSAFRNKSAVYFSAAGLPGPQSVQLCPKLRLIMLDSQWWMQSDLFHPTGNYPGMNKKETRRKALKDLDSLLSDAEKSGEITLLAAHHPLISNGKHSHRKQPLRALLNYTPLHLFSLLGLNRLLREDIPQPRYQRYKKSLLKVISKHPQVIYISGHEHTMQYLIDSGIHYIISGSGHTTTMIDRYRHPSKFMDDEQSGFFSLTLHASGKLMLHAFGIRERGEYWQTEVLQLQN